MSDTVSTSGPDETFVITVRYWAGARAAAGCDTEHVDAADPMTLADLQLLLTQRRDDANRLEKVLGSCSVLLGERPVSSSDPADVTVSPGDTVEFLPPFAGG